MSARFYTDLRIEAVELRQEREMRLGIEPPRRHLLGDDGVGAAQQRDRSLPRREHRLRRRWRQHRAHYIRVVLAGPQARLQAPPEDRQMSENRLGWRGGAVRRR